MSPVRVFRVVVRGVLTLVAVAVFAIGVGFLAIESAWGKNQIRAFLVNQANRFLTARLDIGRLSGSLTSGIELDDVKLSREGQPLIAIDSVVVNYALRELWAGGTTIRALQVTRPRVIADKEGDGRWNLASLVKPNDAPPRTGPPRRIEIRAIEVVDATVLLRTPYQFGPAHVPTDIRSLNASLAFRAGPGGWTLRFNSLSFRGLAPDLSFTSMSGSLGRNDDGWVLGQLTVESPRSAFVVDGEVLNGPTPSVLKMTVRAPRFSFLEWAGIMPPLEHIAVDASFNAKLTGPLNRLGIDLSLDGTGGSAKGQLTFDTIVPGWHGAGAVDLARLNLARWLNRADRPSDVTGRVTFDLDMGFGHYFPRGEYTFDGAHAMYMNYAADDLHARGRLTATEVVIEAATARAYRANLTRTEGAIGLSEPFPFHFKGMMNDLDLRAVPPDVPVPHVESRLDLASYDVAGRFSRPFIAGSASLASSEFLGAEFSGTGTISTETSPVRYSGSGTVAHVDLHRFGDELQVEWLRDPRYAGTISGQFDVEGTSGTSETRALAATGRLTDSRLFDGALSQADVAVRIKDGSLDATVSGMVSGVDPAVPFGDPRLAVTLNGAIDVRVHAQDLLTRPTTRADYRVSGSAHFHDMAVRGIPIQTTDLDATLSDGHLTVNQLQLVGPSIEASGTGVVPLGPDDEVDFRYDVKRADLSRLRPILGADAEGVAVTKGRVTGQLSSLQAEGAASVDGLKAFGLSALTTTGDYSVTLPSAGRPDVRVKAQGSSLQLFGETLDSAEADVTLSGDQTDFDLTLSRASSAAVNLAGSATIRKEAREVELRAFTLTVGTLPWRLERNGASPVVSWTDDGFGITPATLVAGTGRDERVGLAGTVRDDGTGALRVTASHVLLETLESLRTRPPRYSGVLDLDASIRGTRRDPVVSGTVTITDGRVERVAYEKLTGKVDFSQDAATIDVRLDQGPGVWFTAKGVIPANLIDPNRAERPMDLALASSSIDLGLLNGATDVVQRTGGRLQLDVRARGTTHDPQLDGTVNISDASFQVVSTGARYKNGRVALRLSSDRVTVESMHVEDEDGRSLDVQGSLGTRQFRAGDLSIDATARRFTVVDNEFGKIDVNADVRLRGEFDAPRLAGNITVNGNTLKVDRVLERTLFQPYSTQEVAFAPVDAVAALNPWDRLGLDLFLRVPGTLRLTGTNVQVSSGAPVGLGDINLRVGGDLYLYKDPREKVQVTGSLDSVSGTYGFQGRRFTIDESRSSINFVGDLDPNLFVSVTRVIDAVEARVTVSGSLRQPELRLASTPPLDESDILSLIVFNASPSSLSGAQQQELAVRAGALAAGFLATPLLAALENDLGLEAFQIEPVGETGSGPRVTIGEELAPGLVARFSRQFGQSQFNEVTVEYYLSRLLRLRGTFSDAEPTVAQEGFRRIERAGIDLLIFLSF